MATRQDIREAFYSHLETAANPHVPADDISQEYPDDEENYPSIVHNDDYRKVPLNQASGAPSDIEYDSNGDAISEVYDKVREASFGVAILDYDEQRKENTYESIVDYFEKFEEPAWDASTIHSDINQIRVLDANSEDNHDSTPTTRGDRLIIRLEFTREHVKDVDPTTSVNRIGDTS